ncbi:hypothetical protein KC19_3G226100 [Ceratodon purpureus]|uniref:Uncharacterized protein n=1 Tax=Ceratodon purpureus TaxID=3225 RepID=A0A8T0IQJ8_CERPU|nr:hypothetical protein KC19_3G226100 [Ceratodon purpureus]
MVLQHHHNHHHQHCVDEHQGGCFNYVGDRRVCAGMGHAKDRHQMAGSWDSGNEEVMMMEAKLVLGLPFTEYAKTGGVLGPNLGESGDAFNVTVKVSLGECLW